MRTFYSFFIFFILSLFVVSCQNKGNLSPDHVNYKQEMRDFVIGISRYAKTQNPGFIIIPQNGIELVTLSGNENGVPATNYLNAIDGIGQEDLLYGYNQVNEATPPQETRYLKTFLNIAKNAGKTILVTDYCYDKNKMNNSYTWNHASGYLSFAADHLNLNDIPSWPLEPYDQNNHNILKLSDAKNFLYLIDPENFSTKADFIRAVKATNYDVIIMDLFFNDGTPFSASGIRSLKVKPNGGKRLVICYLSIGEAENYRYYWKKEWNTHPPEWLAAENPNWPGDYKVKYWDPQWQAIIYGNDNSYMHKIMTAGFDGVYLDVIDAYEYFENH